MKHRRSIRLRGYDYSQAGYYFITICTFNRENLLGRVVDGQMRLNSMGVIAYNEWHRSGDVRLEIRLDEFVIMPNHIHGIIEITMSSLRRGDRPVAPTERTTPGPRSASIGALLAGFKSSATKLINSYRQTPQMPVWQRNYWERVIRNDGELQRIREYIRYNPTMWEDDDLFVP